MTQYTIFPPRYCLSTLIENAELAAAGPTARITETIICARPFVAPTDALLGDDALIYINEIPVINIRNISEKMTITNHMRN
jgi:hypothetical protein